MLSSQNQYKWPRSHFQTKFKKNIQLITTTSQSDISSKNICKREAYEKKASSEEY